MELALPTPVSLPHYNTWLDNLKFLLQFSANFNEIGSSAVWFSFLKIFLLKVKKTSSSLAHIVKQITRVTRRYKKLPIFSKK
jgi:hypothetical protein